MSTRKPNPTRPRSQTARRRKLHEEARSQARDVYRASILEAAERVFARRGFVECKVADIAREAGLAAGTLYNYFDSKEAIFRSLCVLRGEEALAQARAMAASEEPPMTRLRRMHEWILEHIESHVDGFQVFVEMGPAAILHMRQLGGEQMMANYLEQLALFEQVIAEAQAAGDLRSDISAADLTAALSGTINGFIRAWVFDKPRPRLVERGPVIWELFYNGASSR